MRMENARKSRNHIHFLEDVNGTRFDTPHEIHSHCSDYFQEIVGSEGNAQLFAQEDITSLLDFSCSETESALLEKSFSSKEIKEAFLSLPKNKASGPDGFPPEFFLALWPVLGGEVTEAIKEFFSSGKLLKQWNATNLVLIPKIANASKLSNFRPISCLNTLYKVISTLLANRLKLVLQGVISTSQFVFLSRRSLSENVLLATEIIQGYNRKNIRPRAIA